MEIVPARPPTQASPRWSEYLPAAQVVHTLLPGTPATCPGPHATHSAEPSVEMKSARQSGAGDGNSAGEAVDVSLSEMVRVLASRVGRALVVPGHACNLLRVARHALRGAIGGNEAGEATWSWRWK